MSLFLLFGGAGTPAVVTPIPLYNFASTGGSPALSTTGGQPSIQTTGGTPELDTKGPTG